MRGASGQDHSSNEAPWAMPEPTTVSMTRDGYPSGRHMIDGYRMMAAAARVSGGKYQKEMATVYENAALCIENEAARADRAEALLAAMGSNSIGASIGAPEGHGTEGPVIDGEGSRDGLNPSDPGGAE